MNENGKFSNITRADLLQETDRFGVRHPIDLIADLSEALDSAQKFAAEAGLGAKMVEAIAREFERV